MKSIGLSPSLSAIWKWISISLKLRSSSIIFRKTKAEFPTSSSSVHTMALCHTAFAIRTLPLGPQSGTQVQIESRVELNNEENKSSKSHHFAWLRRRNETCSSEHLRSSRTSKSSSRFGPSLPLISNKVTGWKGVSRGSCLLNSFYWVRLSKWQTEMATLEGPLAIESKRQWK